MYDMVTWAKLQWFVQHKDETNDGLESRVLVSIWWDFFPLISFDLDLDRIGWFRFQQ